MQQAIEAVSNRIQALVITDIPHTYGEMLAYLQQSLSQVPSKAGRVKYYWLAEQTKLRILEDSLEEDYIHCSKAAAAGESVEAEDFCFYKILDPFDVPIIPHASPQFLLYPAMLPESAVETSYMPTKEPPKWYIRPECTKPFDTIRLAQTNRTFADFCEIEVYRSNATSVERSGSATRAHQERKTSRLTKANGQELRKTQSLAASTTAAKGEEHPAIVKKQKQAEANDTRRGASSSTKLTTASAKLPEASSSTTVAVAETTMRPQSLKKPDDYFGSKMYQAHNKRQGYVAGYSGYVDNIALILLLIHNAMLLLYLQT